MSEETLVLGEEFDRLDDRLDELARQYADADDPTTLEAIVSDVETQARALSHLCEEFGRDTEVTVRGLKAGEYAAVEDKVARYRQDADGNPTPGARKNVFVGAGLVDGPWDGLEDADGLDDYVAIVAQRSPGTRDWLFSRINELTTVSAEGFRSFSARLGDSQE